MWRKRMRAVPAPERALGRDEVALGQRRGLGIDDARDLHPVHQGDDQGDDPEARAEKIAASTIASSSAGKAIIRSVKRISTLPIQPRKIAGDDADERADQRRRRRWRRRR